MKPISLFIAISLISMILIGCFEQDFSDLETFVNAERPLPSDALEPLPKARNYLAFAYRAQQMRSPFLPPPDPNEASGEPSVLSRPPDEDRRRDFLERYPLEALSMVGSLNRSGKIWCLIRDPSGAIHRVSHGSFLGLNHGRVVSATEDSIKVIEIVTDGTDDGWIERPRSLNLDSF